MRDDRFDHRPNAEDGRDWSGEAKDPDSPRADVRKLRRLRMTMRLEMRPQEDRERE